jgi:hypothetical protein
MIEDPYVPGVAKPAPTIAVETPEASTHGLHGGNENVAGVPLGADELRLAALRLELFAQAPDLHVDRAVVHLVQSREL